ncbi:hypothetical protein [Streptomyces sp. PD-S100-1]|uniref:hypothetical protein n=1 Tax=Streptomyces sp. PD-S100-1 TaxID=3394351 RepID=UPI0039BC90CA
MDTPLPQLLTELDVLLVESTITEPGFLGAYIEHHGGERVLSMPPGRSRFERDTAARMLLAEGLGLGAPPVPAELRVTRV